ncbi:MAG: hypothetical protein HZT40_15780 [Candidatus Thiothrix singaporensis]|uniref:Uncharacterized protein n=1 Tax=Candidatus Thiothrix singaporensis TaxID=2799669 RepID=A0A7L6AV56_9GAMM|nr:MAG: hypothetical protein HZT40_15780 [Candidatus Thiothrix singaporensis]
MQKSKNACVAERQEELDKCEARVKELNEIESNKMAKDYPDASAQEKLLWALTRGITGKSVQI